MGPRNKFELSAQDEAALREIRNSLAISGFDVSAEAQALIRENFAVLGGEAGYVEKITEFRSNGLSEDEAYDRLSQLILEQLENTGG